MKKSTLFIRTTVLFLLMAFVTIMFTGCETSKTAVTAADFKSVATEKGLQYSDATAQFSNYDFVEEVTIAHPEDISYQIEFYVFSDTSNAQSFFAENKGDFEAVKSNSYSESSKSGENYSSYKLTSDGKYMFVEYVENTAVFVNEDNENKSAIEEFIKALKY